MCGIAGWVDFKNPIDNYTVAAEEMGRRLQNRGPDAQGVYISKNAVLVHRRLIVVDPENGKQPMERFENGKHYCLVYNGELYNTQELRDDLKKLGYSFNGHSDTEVLLNSFIAWGEDCLEKLNGIFAFCIWIEEDNYLFMARDRMGVKPLFYAVVNDVLIFGSEIKALLAHPLLKPQIDNQGIADIFLLGPARRPGYGVFKNIEELQSAFCAVYNKDGIKKWQYWELESHPFEDSLDTAIEKVRWLFCDAISRQLVSDVPVCTFLSGGLDSTAITAAAARHYENNGLGELNTFSIDYIDNDKFFKAGIFQPNADAPWAKLAAERIGSVHHNVLLDTDVLTNALQDAVLARDLPGMADVDSSLLLFCREIKKTATVGLSGECADEVFGGYPWYHREEMLNSNTFPWSRSVSMRSSLLKDGILGNIKPFDYVQEQYNNTIKAVPKLANEDESAARQRQMLYLNLKWFMVTLLDRKDRMSMATGLEVRVPFCDHRIVEYVWNIPPEYKYLGGKEKGLLRHALKDLLPEEILNRKKSPYPKTHNPAYMQATKKLLTDIINNPGSPILGIINKKEVEALIATEASAFGATPWFGQLMTGPQIFAYLIQTNFWLKEYNIEII